MKDFRLMREGCWLIEWNALACRVEVQGLKLTNPIRLIMLPRTKVAHCFSLNRRTTIVCCVFLLSVDPTQPNIGW